ncbi:MAG: hypothetical protein K6A23_16120 [Butyrivibrio sp.]|nr:hypothetical protein [Butyrivibrio sp.]
MDKYEYKVRADEIKSLIKERRFAEAVEIADIIDWKRVKSIAMLCTISDLYKYNRRFEESKDILLLAYDRYPLGRNIVYSLCELSIKMGEFVQAIEYYKEFVRIAPRDTARYILQYKLYEAQDVSLEERIAVLEELKKHDYKEKWAYELAYLYHRVGLTTECVEECDEMFLWFGEGRYVMKALELKALHEPLSPEQQDRYTRYKSGFTGGVTESVLDEKEESEGENLVKQPTKELPPVEQTYDQQYVQNQYTNPEVQYNQAYAQQQYDPQNQYSQTDNSYQYDNQQQYQNAYEYIQNQGYNQVTDDTRVFSPVSDETKVYSAVSDETKVFEQPVVENDIEIKPVDVGNFNTINLQEALAESLREVIGDDQETKAFSGAENYQNASEAPDMQEVFFNTQEQEPEKIAATMTSEFEAQLQKEDPFVRAAQRHQESGPKNSNGEALQHNGFAVPFTDEPLQDEVPGAVIKPNVRYKSDNHFENILSQDYDGQISMVVQEEKQVEQQITGQISISDFMENWEQYKKQQQQQQLDRIKKRVSDETGDMFADFDEKTKAGLQERIEKAIADALQKEKEENVHSKKAKERQEQLLNEVVSQVVDSEEDEPVEITPGSTVKPDNIITPEYSSEGLEDLARKTLKTIDDRKNKSKEGTVETETTEEISEEPSEEALQDLESEDEAVLQEAVENDKEITETEEETAEETEIEAEDSQAVSETESEISDKDDAEVIKEKKADKEKKKQPVEKLYKDSDEEKTEKSVDKESREIEERVRTMTPEEKELFGPYIHHKKSRRQIINAIDSLSMASYTNNAIVTGEEGAGTVSLAKGLIKSVQVSDSNFSGKVAKITANSLNKKSVNTILEKLSNGALIIQRATDMKADTVANLQKALQNENRGMIVILEDTKEEIDKFLEKNPGLKESFNVRVDIEALDDESLVAYAKQYALEKEYAIDNLGILALHTCIEERQTLDHDVTLAEVKDIVDDAIYYADKKSVSHFVDTLVGKRFDDEDMIILREKDFMH